MAGVSFRVVLDSRIIVRRNPWLVAGLSMSQINQAQVQLGAQPQTPLTQSGECVVIGMRHVGDSRGSDPNASGDAGYRHADDCAQRRVTCG
jgi:hypothetical protein